MEKISKLVEIYRDKFPKWRYGQTVFNATYTICPEIADTLRASDIDPFFNDNLVPQFLKEVEKLADETKHN